LILEDHTRKIASSIPQSKLIILPNEGHGTYISHSDKLFHIIKPFLDDDSEYSGENN
jgi:pimeloyl-ACP methyl ester carboxylesterase